MAKLVSILVPTYNEEENVVPLAEAITEQMGSLDYDYELIFIDNDSQDTTRDKLRVLCSKDKRIKAIFNARTCSSSPAPLINMRRKKSTMECTAVSDWPTPTVSTKIVS